MQLAYIFLGLFGKAVIEVLKVSDDIQLSIPRLAN